MSACFKYCFLSIFCLSIQWTYGQSAKQVLTDIQSDYQEYMSLDLDLFISIQYPDGGINESQARLVQSGAKYYFDHSDQTVINDEELLWVYLKDMNEVQLNDADDSEDQIVSMSPKKLLALVTTDDFQSAFLTDDQIEIKPLSPDEEYSKIRIGLSPNLKDIDKISIFGKDGSRIVLQIKDRAFDTSAPSELFSFDPSKHPGIHIEDLRL